MTKAKVKELYQEWTNTICDNAWNDNTLEELKEINEGLGNSKWCSWDQNLIEIIQSGNRSAITKALLAYQKHYMIEGMNEAHKGLALATNNMNI